MKVCFPGFAAYSVPSTICVLLKFDVSEERVWSAFIENDETATVGN